MASKGAKRNKYSNVFIAQVIKENQKEGKSEAVSAKKYGIPKGIISIWVMI